ncbi:MAG: hypothetical protein HYY46_01315 [Deltaproteobacteria bacterium]|nr:hypothetical protein [Deltaproteobacteria bacterium]
MKSVEDYFNQVRQLINHTPETNIERYEEQILSENRGVLRIRLRFPDEGLLEISEAIVIVAGEPHWIAYRYHYQGPSAELVFRYDNAPHHPEIPTYPDHKHSGDQVQSSPHPSIEQVLLEVVAIRGRVRRS